MIVIRLELWPRGEESQKRLLGLAQIANVGGTVDLGDYDATIFKSPEHATRPGVWKRGPGRDGLGTTTASSRRKRRRRASSALADGARE